MNGQGRGAVDQACYSLGDNFLGSIQAGQKHACRLANGGCDHRSLGQFQIERGLDEFLCDLQQLHREGPELLGWQATVAVVHGFRQGVGDAGPDPDHRRLLDAEPHGDGVGGLEADAADVACQAVGVFGHDLDGIRTVGLEDANGPGRSDAVAVQENHDLPHDLLLRPGVGNALGADSADAGYLA